MLYASAAANVMPAKAQQVKLAGCAGVKNLLEEEAIRVGGSNHSHATQDLYDNIAQGNYPEWTLYIQTMDPADEHKCVLEPFLVSLP